jgi:hypothetical protein
LNGSLNVYLSHFGGDPIESTAYIFECSYDEIVKLDFVKEAKEGLYQVNRGFVSKEFLRSCKKFKELCKEQILEVEGILHVHSPGAEILFSDMELTEMFSLYVVPASFYFYQECFYNPFEVTYASLS